MTEESIIDEEYYRVDSKPPDGTEYEAFIGKKLEFGAIFTPYIPEKLNKENKNV